MKLETSYFSAKPSNRITNYCTLTDIGVNYVANTKKAREADEPTFPSQREEHRRINFKILELHAKFESQRLY